MREVAELEAAGFAETTEAEGSKLFFAFANPNIKNISSAGIAESYEFLPP